MRIGVLTSANNRNTELATVAFHTVLNICQLLPMTPGLPGLLEESAGGSSTALAWSSPSSASSAPANCARRQPAGADGAGAGNRAMAGLCLKGVLRGGGGLGPKSLCPRNGPNKIFPIVNSVFSPHNGHFWSGGGGVS